MRLAVSTFSGWVTLVALVVAALAFTVLEVAGLTDTPRIPPGLVLILLAAVLIAVVPGRWTPVAGAAAALFNLVVMFAVGADQRLVAPKSIVDLMGGWILVAALVTGSAAGLAAAIQRSDKHLA